MITKYTTFTGQHKTKLECSMWLPEEKPIAILQVLHGMTEHMGRYEKLAKLLTKNGIAVVGFDLRGHGKNKDNRVREEIASFGKGCWHLTLLDIYDYGRVIASEFPDVPRFMLGFSLGSFLLREYLCRYNNPLDGAIIMGTGYQPSFVLKIINKMVLKEIDKAGFDNTTKTVKQLSFGTYNKQFKPCTYECEWLCSDMKELGKYMEDPLCKEGISSGLFWQLLNSMETVGNKDIYKYYRKNMPILLLSGEEDPVGNNGKGVRKVYNTMKKYFVGPVEMKLFKNARHDILHEEENGVAKEVRLVILKWILKQLKAPNNQYQYSEGKIVK